VKKKEVFEKLADIEHQRWADWQKYMHSKMLPSAKGGIYEIGEDFITRWEKQIKTSYKDLTEKEKDSDREQVMRYFPIIQSLLKEKDGEYIKLLEDWIQDKKIDFKQAIIEAIIKLKQI